MNTRIEIDDEGTELQSVMSDYFDALLHGTATSPEPSAIEADAAVAVVSIAVEKTVVETRPEVDDCATEVPALPTVAETELSASDAEQSAATPSYQLIRSGGLTLGIPAHAIAKIVTAPVQLAALDDAHVWVLGAYRAGTDLYTVVDTAALLVPGSKLQAAVGAYTVLLAGQRWALACDGIGERISPDPAQVTWRGAQGKRPWLAGTLRAPTCALLDIPELLRLLEV